LKSNSSGSEGSGGSGGSGGNDSGDSGSAMYSIVLNLTGVTPSNVASSVTSGSVYINQLSVGEGYELSTPVITMNGYDVSDQYYSGDGVISIPNVQGDIVITCKALAVKVLAFTGVTGSYPPNTTTFEYTPAANHAQYNVVEDTETIGGTLRFSWDTERITGGPIVMIYLFKDGLPYKVGGRDDTLTTEDVVEGENINVGYWFEPGAIPAAASRMIQATAPCSIKIPAGCTAMACLRAGNLALDGTTILNSTFPGFIKNGNIIATMTEGE
jgi:hypothetical protein